MTIPDFDTETGLLPGGEHEATWSELADRLGFTYRRRILLDNLRVVLDELLAHGVETIWIDGSFVTSKPSPQDVDVVYLPPIGADITTWGMLAPIARRDLKKCRRVDLWEYPSRQRKGTWGPAPRPITEYFQSDEDGRQKGIVVLRKQP